jgi:rod shape-determining protein MreC
MEFPLHRYRNITVLVLTIFAQLILLAYQVKTQSDVRLIRIWAVTAVTPLARVLEGVHDGVMGFLNGYVFLHDVNGQNLRLKEEVGRLKLQNQFLVNQLNTAEHGSALAAFQARTPSRTVPARVIGTGTGANSRVVFVDRGSASGILRGMAVITPDGIVGKVLAAYPTASQVQMITDPSFAAGVVSQRHRVLGIVKGQGQELCRVEYVQNEEQVDTGEMFYTTGDDRVFPRGLPVGVVKVVRNGSGSKEIFLAPTGPQGGLDAVLIVLEGVHQQIPEYQAAPSPVALLPAPPDAPRAAGSKPETETEAKPGIEADRLREQYKKIGAAQNHVFGEGLPGSKPPDFNLKPGAEPRKTNLLRPAPAKPEDEPSGPTEAPPPSQP